MLEKAVEEIQKDIDEDNDKDNIIGIQAFHFKLIINEDITTNIILIILFIRFMEKIGLLKGRVYIYCCRGCLARLLAKRPLFCFLYCWGAFLFFVLLFYLGYGMDEVMM